MGTSSSNTGARGNTSLLPSWAPGAPLPPTPPQQNLKPGNQGAVDLAIPSLSKSGKNNSNLQTDKWSGSKGALTRYAKGTGGGNIKKAAQGYVRTYGGYKKAASASQRGIIVGAGLAAFLEGVSAEGLKKTFDDLGISDFVGKSSEEILAKIADTIAPAGATNDEAVAREAVISSLDNLCEKLINEGKDISAIDHMSEAMVKETVIEYIGIYIFKKWLYELGIAIEKNNLSERDAIKLEKEMEVFIKEELKVGLKDMDVKKFQIKAINNHPVIKEIIELTYSTLEK